MTACNYLFLLVVCMLICGGSARVYAAGDETATPSPGPSTTATTTSTAASGAKTVAHKSSHHRKKKSAVAGTTGTGKATAGTTNVAGTAAGTGTGTTAKTNVTGTATGSTEKTGTPTVAKIPPSGHRRGHSKSHAITSATTPKPDTFSAEMPSGPLTPYPSVTPQTTSANPTGSLTVSKPGGDSHSEITMSAPAPAAGHPLGGPEVDTGLPVARHSGNLGGDAGGYSHDSSYQIASAIPIPPVESYSTRIRVKNALDNFTFTNFTRHVRNVYPWKINIFTTKFWIGEGSTPISSTTNVASAWDEDWRSNNGGNDSPDARRGYMPAYHAARLNPFYVALPFNDLAFPEKARRWLPAGWTRPPRDGKQVSACKDRWVEIKNAQGDTCYAQWEDVGPLRYDHAEYVFGDERPDTFTSGGLDRAGLDVSPAVADYLDITGKNCMTRWRFVDDADVVPGKWLQYDEEAVIFKALHELKDDPTRVLPIEKAAAPIDDENDMDSVKKRIGAAKG